jgi:hypothetical protein
VNLWRKENARYSPALFTEELVGTLKRIREGIAVGTVYETKNSGALVRRVLMERTEYHVYYVREGDVCFVVSIWGARRGRGPRFRK